MSFGGASGVPAIVYKASFIVVVFVIVVKIELFFRETDHGDLVTVIRWQRHLCGGRRN